MLQRCLDAAFLFSVLAYFAGFSLLVVANVNVKNNGVDLPWSPVVDADNRTTTEVVLHGCVAGGMALSFIGRCYRSADVECNKRMSFMALYIAVLGCFLEIITMPEVEDLNQGVMSIVGSGLCLGSTLILIVDSCVHLRWLNVTQVPQPLVEGTAASSTQGPASSYGSMDQTASSDVPIPAANDASSGADPPGSGPVLPLPDCQQSEPPSAEDGAGGQLKQDQDLLTPQQGQCDMVIEQDGAKDQEGKE